MSGRPCKRFAAGATCGCHFTHPNRTQLDCGGRAAGNNTGESTQFTTGKTGTNIPTINATGPVNCSLTLTATDVFGQNGTVTGIVTVSKRMEEEFNCSRKSRSRCPACCSQRARCAASGVAATLGRSMAFHPLRDVLSAPQATT